jgi:hypothetical protein
MVWNGRPRERRLLDECHGRSEWNGAAAALRLRWESPRPVKGQGRCIQWRFTDRGRLSRYPTVTDTRSSSRSAATNAAEDRPCRRLSPVLAACGDGGRCHQFTRPSLLPRIGRPLARQALTACLLLGARQDLIAPVLLAGPKLDSRESRKEREDET